MATARKTLRTYIRVGGKVDVVKVTVGKGGMRMELRQNKWMMIDVRISWRAVQKIKIVAAIPTKNSRHLRDGDAVLVLLVLRLLLLGAGLTGEGAGMVGTHDLVR